MKNYKIIVLGITSVILTFIKCTSGDLKISKLSSDGNSNFLIGKSNINNKILFSSMHLIEDRLSVDILDLNKNIICKGYIYGNYIHDSLMIVFDKKSKPYLYNPEKNLKTYINSPDSSYMELRSVKIQKMHDKYGLFINLDSSLKFDGINTSEAIIITRLRDFNNNYSSILSFDILDDRCIVCLKKPINNNEFFVDYFIGDLSTKKFKKIFSIKNKTSFKYKYEPVVSFFDANIYYTSFYYNDQVYLLKNSIQKRRCINKWHLRGDLEIFNIATDKNFVYLNLFNKKYQDNFKGSFDEKIIEGYNIYRADFP